MVWVYLLRPPGFFHLSVLGAKVDSPPDLSHVGGKLERKKWVRRAPMSIPGDGTEPLVPTTTTSHNLEKITSHNGRKTI